MRLPTWNIVSLVPATQEKCGKTGDGLKEAIKIFKGWKDRVSGVFFPWREGVSEGPSSQNSSTYRVTTKRVEALREPMEEARDNRHEVYQERIHPGIEKKFFTLRTISHWNNLPRNVVVLITGASQSD